MGKLHLSQPDNLFLGTVQANCRSIRGRYRWKNCNSVGWQHADLNQPAMGRSHLLCSMVFPEKDVMLISPVHAAAGGPVLLFKRKLSRAKVSKTAIKLFTLAFAPRLRLCGNREARNMDLAHHDLSIEWSGHDELVGTS
jgi:hypothetical protein